jgi:hypothetical protein
MTVRDDLYRSKIKIVKIMTPIILFYVLLLFFGPNALGPTYTGVAVIFLLVGIFVLFAVSYKKALCPECGFNFYFLSVKKRASNQVDYCPGCGLALDKDLA